MKNKKQELKSGWYDNLLKDIKNLYGKGIVRTKWEIGQRIIQEKSKFEKQEYGSKRIENLAKDLKIGTRELYYCIQFAEKVSQEEIDTWCQYSWKKIRNEIIPEHKPRPEIAKLPNGKYNIIYGDPPWQCYGEGDRDPTQHYDTLSLENLKRIKINEIGADNCILFLWVTGPAFPQALELIKEWGFKYSTVEFVWIKSKKDKTGFAFGMGNWTRANAEYCLIATKGSIPRQDKGISQIIYEPLEEHSKKPDMVRDKIIQLVGDLPRIELFARQKTEGWEVWGNQVPEENAKKIE